ncbi:MAG: serine O-acetyltransferase [Cyclobacteriaceae bacterium]|jgi:serine O-acetyltransferase
MNSSFIAKVFFKHQECQKCPPTKEVVRFFDDLMGILFPGFNSTSYASIEEVEKEFDALKTRMPAILNTRYDIDVEKVSIDFFDNIPTIYSLLLKDVEALFSGDPAALNTSEVIRTYPGFYAIAAYRFANLLLHLGSVNIPRMITENAHSRTGIDIHPGATIGEYFCIDHGTGVVIGETSEIGNHVKIYQGVTLGALSVNKSDAKTKRHPTIQDHVVIYAGATILGGKTIIGANSIVGGNVWLTKSIPENSRVYYQAMMHNENGNESDLIVIKKA